jgi:hypothetical protein
VVSATNPRYFTRSGDGEAVYLSGSHIWNNFHDGMGPGSDCAQTAEALDFEAYLRFLADHGHNFIRLWRWEQFKSQAAGGGFHLCMSPQPWPRSGSGTATDGGPRFDLSTFDPAYFDRLRDRVIAAGDRGIYVAVMLFDGWALHLSPSPDNVDGHPFHASNNVNDIVITSIIDYQVLPLDPRVQALQEAYVRKVVDTVQDLPNVLYEVANESSGGGTVDEAFAEALGVSGSPEWGDSTEWQYWVIDLVKQYEREQDYESHPIGMTMQFPVPRQREVNSPLFASRADWISPGFEEEDFHPGDPAGPASRWFEDPPVADGTKVLIADTDHFAPGGGNALWAWKSFLRGHHPILMDFGLIDGVVPTDHPSPGVPPYGAMEPARYAMGDTVRFAQRMNLIAMEPMGDLSSTGYALAEPGEEYLVLQTDGGQPFTMTLDPGTYALEWFGVDDRETAGADQTTVTEGSARFTAPFSEGPTVLYLKKVPLTSA